MASLLGIKIQADYLSPEHDAFIYPAKGQQLEIVFNATRPTTRQNFSTCHEITHTLFPDHFEMIRNRYRHRAKFDPERELESLCDVGAVELLLPEDSFRRNVNRYGFGLDAVVPLREQYQASREPVVRRMVRLDPGRSAAVFLEYRLKPSEVAAMKQGSLPNIAGPVTPKKLRIAYAVTSMEFGIFLPRHKSIPQDSCAYRALATGDIEKSLEAWDIRNLPVCRVEAMPLPAGDDPDASLKAVALLGVLRVLRDVAKYGK